mmetsp:Transcript_29975/g.75554  ORF Transcript_29975/g.75554 Transcript_29975/m.75554 type:complete len:477 (+) Transcript_29975:60-1490(+)
MAFVGEVLVTSKFRYSDAVWASAHPRNHTDAAGCCAHGIATLLQWSVRGVARTLAQQLDSVVAAASLHTAGQAQVAEDGISRLVPVTEPSSADEAIINTDEVLAEASGTAAPSAEVAVVAAANEQLASIFSGTPVLHFRVKFEGKTHPVEASPSESIRDFCSRMSILLLSESSPQDAAAIQFSFRRSSGTMTDLLAAADSAALVGAILPDRTVLNASCSGGCASQSEVRALQVEARMLQWESERLSKELRGLHVLTMRMSGQKSVEKIPGAGSELSALWEDLAPTRLRAAIKALRSENARLLRELKGVEALAHRMRGNRQTPGTGRDNYRVWRGQVVQGTVRQMPRDGSCLFHGLASSLLGATAAQLRREICDFIERRPDAVMAGKPLSEWVLWESGQSHSDYVDMMRSSGEWGGPLEIAVCTHLMNVDVHVYQEVPGGGFQRLVTFEAEDGVESHGLINLVFEPGHYNVLDVIDA